MSNKGAIKKSTSKDGLKSTTRSKPKSNSEDAEAAGKSESKVSKKPQTSERGDGDKRQRSTQRASVTKTQSTRTVTKPSTRSLQSKPSAESTSSSKTIGNIKVASRSVTNTRTRTEVPKRSSNSNATGVSKSRDSNRAAYSEKRGTSTIYVPQSTASKLAAKSVDRNRGTLKTNDKTNSRTDRSQSRISRERKLSRTLSPSEVKMLHAASNRSRSSQRTDKNKKVPTKEKAPDNAEEEYDYEDDFEDYESDFQEVTDSDASQISEETDDSQADPQEDPIELRTTEQRKTVHSAEHQRTEEEHMHDSGHYELAEARRRAAKIESIGTNQSNSPLLELRQPVNKAYSDDRNEDRPMENKSLPSSTDEGFEDSRSGDFTKSPPLSQISFIDFKRKEDRNVKKEKKKTSRGKQLLEMIKLDTMGWSLLEHMPIPYDEFIRSYGKLNSQQMSTQTRDDDVEMESQTDKIPYTNKWTQFPVTYSKRDSDLFRMDRIDVGSDDYETTNSTVPSYDILRLSDFVDRAGKVVLSLLEERTLGDSVFKNEDKKLPFSDGVLKLSVDSVTFLSGRAVTIIHYSESLSKVLLTVHSPSEEEIETSSKQDYITDCCIGCVWNISEPSMPIKLFYSPCTITACCFHLTNYNVVLAGLEDGSISLWDLKEDATWHQKVMDKANELDWIVRSPTYTTATSTETNAHGSIVSIRILSKIEENSDEQRNRFVPIQICSLDEDGSLVIWSVLHNMGVNIDDLGLSYWGDIRLVKSQEILLKSNSTKRNHTNGFVDLHVDSADTNNLYVATNTTSIMHATYIGNKTNPLAYENSETNPSGNVTCIEVCPFERSFFLVGCDDGTIRLHSLNVEKPILQLKGDRSSKVQAVQWSKSKPFTIYVLDNNSCIHVWDLSNSDIHPMQTVNLQSWGHVSSMQLSPIKRDRDTSNQYMALGTETGSVEIHKLNSKFHYSKKEDFLEELNTFMRYVAIL